MRMHRTLTGLAVIVAMWMPPAAHAAELFFEDFSDNNAGWLFDDTWQRGSATTSSGHQFGNPDPALDHTLTADNGVAGVIIGGNAPTNVAGFRWLTSPEVDTAVNGSVFLEYYRWLNSDHPPFMTSSVQVWNGSVWTTLWQNAVFVTDAAWTQHAFDVTAYKNADFRVRFGYTVQSAGVFRMSGWNVDDVSILAPSVAVIPEPEAYAMLVAGLGLLGFVGRRRKRAAA